MEAKDALAEALRESEVWRQIDEKLTSQGTLELFDDQRVLTIEADRLARGKLSTSDGRPVTVRSVEADGTSVRYDSAKVVIGQDGGSSLSQSTFALTLEAYDRIDEKRFGSSRAALTSS